MAQRFVADYELSEYDATTLTQSRSMAAYFEAATKACGQPKLAGNWIMGEVSRRLNISELGIGQSPVTALQLAALISRIQDNTISNNAAKLVFERLWMTQDSGVQPISEQVDFLAALEFIDKVIAQDGLAQLNDLSELEKIVDEVLAANPKNVDQYKAGNDKALNALVGQIMKASKGKANPQQVNDLLRKKLA
jgi:aspartyl-tRNA(Asn)/glutamyl-tRNA(Gln) amidotransferase subunit B